MVSIQPANTAGVIPLVSPERAELVKRRLESPLTSLWDALDAVKDPEIPVLSLWDLGVLQDLQATPTGVTVVITTTYSGCPAMDTMAEDIEQTLHRCGVEQVTIQTRLSPAWSTDWLDAQARTALREYGIAPPASATTASSGVQNSDSQGLTAVPCPSCDSNDTHLISEFGSTSCKALYQCQSCSEPFDYFKPL